MMKRLHLLLLFSLQLGFGAIGSTLPSSAVAQTTASRAAAPRIASTDVVVYPNPSNGIVHLDINGFEKRRVELRVLNVIGSVVYRETLTELNYRFTKTLDLSKFTSGLYYVKLEADNATEMRKLVIR